LTVNKFCCYIEQINHDYHDKLVQLVKKPSSTDSNHDQRPRPPVRDSSLYSSTTSTNLPGKYSLPNTKTATTNELLVDYDSLLSYLTLKYGSPGERESCLRWFRDTQYPYVCRNGTFPSWFHGNITRQ